MKDSKTEPASEANEHYPFTGLEKRAVNYVATDDLAMFADGDTRMIYEHYYIKGSEIENSKLLEEITSLKAELERESTIRDLLRIIDSNQFYMTDSELEKVKAARQKIDYGKDR